MKEHNPAERMISVPEKTLLRMAMRLTQGRNLFPEKVEEATRLLKNAKFKTPLK
jgi:hypothetical protein